jgi:hypothetical protein
MKILNIIIRIIAFPFVIGLVLVKVNCSAIIDCFSFLMYGGEYIKYDRQTKATMADIYHELKSKK